MLKYILGGGIIVSLAGCLAGASLVELHSIAGFAAIEDKNYYGKNTLTIQGLLVSSAQGVNTVKVHQEQDVLNILVYARFANARRSGNLNYQFVIPKNISEINFVKNRNVLWLRDKGVVSYSFNQIP